MQTDRILFCTEPISVTQLSIHAVLSLYKYLFIPHYKQIVALSQEVHEAIVSVHGIHLLLL